MVPGAAAMGVTKPVDAIVTTVWWDQRGGRQCVVSPFPPVEQRGIKEMGRRTATDARQRTSCVAATRGRDSDRVREYVRVRGAQAKQTG